MTYGGSGFTRHGFLATYLLGGCRCELCTARILAEDSIRQLRPRYNWD